MYAFMWCVWNSRAYPARSLLFGCGKLRIGDYGKNFTLFIMLLPLEEKQIQIKNLLCDQKSYATTAVILAMNVIDWIREDLAVDHYIVCNTYL